MAGITHVFHDVYLGWSHRSLTALFESKTGKETVPKGDVAVFLNKSWTGVKILCPGNLLLYFRSVSGAPITKEQLRTIPTLLGAPKFGFGGSTEARLMKAFDTKFGTQIKRMRVVSGD